MNTNDKHMIDDLVERGDALRAMARSLLRGRPDDAEDLTQEVWLKTLRSPIPAFMNPKAWLRRVTRNTAFETQRREATRKRHESVPKGGNVPATDELVLRAEVHRALIEAVLGLPEQSRRIILLRYFEGLNSSEIAAQERIPASTVRSNLERSLEVLGRRLGKDHGGSWRSLCLMALGWPVPKRIGFLAGGILVTTNSKILTVCAACFLIGASGLWLFTSDGDAKSLSGGARISSLDGAATVSRDLGTKTDDAGIFAEDHGSSERDGAALSSQNAVALGRVSVLTVPRGADLSPLELILESQLKGESHQVKVTSDGQLTVPVGDWSIRPLQPEWRCAESVVQVREGSTATIWLLSSAHLRLRVTDELSRGIAEAEIRWLPTAHHFDFVSEHAVTCQTDAQGCALLSLAEAAGTLEVSAPGFRIETRQLISASDEELVVVLERRNGDERCVLVVDRSSQNPVPGARGRNLGTSAHAGPSSDSEGRLELDAHVGFGRNLVIEKIGYLPHRCGPQDLEDGNRIEILPLRSIAVRVVNSIGIPLQGAAVFPTALGDETYCSDVGFLSEVKTGSDGVATMALPVGLPISLAAQAEDGSCGEVELTVDDLTEVVRIKMGGGSGLQLIVVDETGQPISEAQVRASWQGRGYGRSRTSALRAGGTLVLPAPDQLEGFLVTASGYVTQSFQRRAEFDQPAAGVLRLRMARGCSLEGRLVTTEGEAVPGLEVQIWLGNRISSPETHNRKPIPSEHPAWGIRAFAPPVIVMAASDGRFRAEDLPAGLVQVAVELPRILDPAGSSSHDSSLIEVRLPRAEPIDCVVEELRQVVLDVVDESSGIAIQDFRVERRPGGIRSYDDHLRAHWEGFVPTATESLLISAKGYEVHELLLDGNKVDFRRRLRLKSTAPQVLVFDANKELVAGRMLQVAVLDPQKDASGQMNYYVAWNDTIVVSEDGRAQLTLAFPKGAPLSIGGFEVDGERYLIDPDIITWQPGVLTKLRCVKKKRD